MKIFEASENFFIKSGMVVPDKSLWTSVKTFLLNLLYVSVIGPLMIVSCILFIYYHHDDLLECVNSLICLSQSLMIFPLYLCLRISSEQIQNYIESFRALVDHGL